MHHFFDSLINCGGNDLSARYSVHARVPVDSLRGRFAVTVGDACRPQRPANPGARVVARAVVDCLIPERCRVEFETTCSVGERIVLAGRALTQVPSRTAQAPPEA